MKHWTLRIVILLLLGAIVNVAVGTTTTGDRQALDIRYLELAIDSYFVDTGSYPITDASGTWFEKMLAGGYLRNDDLRAGTSQDGSLPVDVFGQPLIYEINSSDSHREVIIRSIGRDGVDNAGAGDDWDSRYGANLGHWNKANWPEFFMSLGLGWATAIAVGLIIYFQSHRVVRSLVLLLLIGGTWSGVVLPFIFDFGPIMGSTASRMPFWADDVGIISLTIVPLAILFAILDRTSREVAERRRAQESRCLKCGYPIGSSSVCTECGVELPSKRRRDEATAQR